MKVSETNLKLQNKKTLANKVYKGFLVLGAGIEPALTLLPTGF